MTFTRKGLCFDSRLQAPKDQHSFLGEKKKKKTVALLRIQSKSECAKEKNKPRTLFHLIVIWLAFKSHTQYI